MGTLKYTEGYLKQICKEKDLDYICLDNFLYNSKNRRVLKFICKKHTEKGIQILPVEKIVHNKKPCQFCNHAKLKETFKEEMARINPNIEILSDYKNWGTKVKCRCKIDGYEWDGNVPTLLYGGGCKLCGHKKNWDSRGRITTVEFKKKMNTVNKNIEIIGEYHGSHNPIKCRCLIDGCEWESYASNLLNETAGCPECAKKHLKEIGKLSDEDFATRVHQTNPNIAILSKYTNAHAKMKFKCRTHDYIFTTTPCNFLYKGGKGCPYCNQSMGEKKMITILEKLGLNLIQQHTFEDCVHINKLRFDAFDTRNKILFEYQGQQHYYPVDFAGKGDNWAEEQYSIVKMRDEIKRQYCKDNKIPLIEIPYWEYDNMENYLTNEIKKYIA